MRILLLFVILCASACAGTAATASLNTPQLIPPGAKEAKKMKKADEWRMRQGTRVYFDEKWGKPIGRENFIDHYRDLPAEPPKP